MLQATFTRLGKLGFTAIPIDLNGRFIHVEKCGNIVDKTYKRFDQSS
jgi:hypothetical protein